MSSKAKSSTATKGNDPSPARKPTTISSLPYDLLLNCLARVPRWLYHRRLSLVCKKFRTIVASPDIYKTRVLVNRTERCLYLCLRFPSDPITQWFTLSKKIKGNVQSTYSTGNVFIPIPSTDCPSAKPANIISVGSDIYQIGGQSDEHPDTKVSVLDCKSNTWRSAPDMRVERRYSTASVVDGKIYVAGLRDDGDPTLKWFEVFDPNTQTWSSVKNPGIKERMRYGRIFRSLGLEGKFYFFGDEDVVYDPEEDKWRPLGRDSLMSYVVKSNHIHITSYCVIDDVLFFYDGVFKWYDLKVNLWKELIGLEGLDFIKSRGVVKMVDHVGKMAILWFEPRCLYDGSQIFQIWCAEVSLERRHGDEIWGKVEWFDDVATVRICDFTRVDVLSAIV